MHATRPVLGAWGGTHRLPTLCCGVGEHMPPALPVLWVGGGWQTWRGGLRQGKGVGPRGRGVGLAGRGVKRGRGL